MPVAIHWQRLDTSGSEGALLEEKKDRWLLSGSATFMEEQQPCCLNYAITCTLDWRTLAVDVTGHIGAHKQVIKIKVHNDSWVLNGKLQPQLNGCLDIDLGFSPATNLLPIKRLALAIGESRTVTAAWLRFPSMTLVPLNQIYTRETVTRYRYESPENNFISAVETNGHGFVTSYPGLWEAIGSTP